MTFQKFLLLSTVFLIPLIGARGNFGYEQIKVFSFIFLISLIGFVWVLKWRFKWTKIKTVSLAFVLVLLVTSLLGTDQWNSLLGKGPYFQGWVVYAYLWLFSAMLASSNIKLSQWTLVITLSAVLVAFASVREWVSLYLFNQHIPTYAGRVVSTFGQPNFYAGFLLLGLPFSYHLFAIARSKVTKQSSKIWMLGWGSGLLSMVGILVSFSRSAILLALLLLVLGLIDQLKIKLKIGLLVFGIVCISIFLGLRFSSGIVGNEISSPVFTKNPDLTRESVEKRAYIWPVAWQVIWQRPLVGYGLENISEAFAVYFEKNKHPLFEENLNISPVLISLKELNIDRSHSYVLDLLLFSGGVGLLGWLGLVGMLFWKLRQTYRDSPRLRRVGAGRGTNVLLVSLVVYLIWVQFQNQSIVHLIYFWLLVGLIDRHEV